MSWFVDKMIQQQISALLGDMSPESKVEVSGGCVTIEDVHFNESLIEDMLAQSGEHHHGPSTRPACYRYRYMRQYQAWCPP